MHQGSTTGWSTGRRSSATPGSGRGPIGSAWTPVSYCTGPVDCPTRPSCSTARRRPPPHGTATCRRRCLFVGDWDGDGADTLLVRRGNVFHVRNSTVSGPADYTFVFGDPGDVVLVG